MKEWAIRFCFVILGVVLTLGTLKIIDFVKGPEEVETEIVEVPVITTVVAEESKVTEEDFADEARAMFDSLFSTTPTTAVEEEESESEDESEDTGAKLKWKEDYPMIDSDCTLEEKMAERSSYEETMATNAFDKMVIENSTIDFSGVKISVMGDSITEGNTLPEDEKEEYNWPAQLASILGCEVENFGIGGSTVSNVVDNYPMCERWNEIPTDSDIIIVMGGSNDMLFENKWQYGELEYDKRMTEGTFCGDLDRMLGAMKWTYQDNNEDGYTELIYINPPSCILQDGVYNVDPGNMVHQSEFAEAINTIAPAYNFSVIDLYNNNFLNSHDADINALYINDGIHGNKEAYRILAEHIASQIIQRIEQ